MTLIVRLARLSAMYTIYGKPDCPHCVRATALLEYNSIDYHYITSAVTNLPGSTSRRRLASRLCLSLLTVMVLLSVATMI